MVPVELLLAPTTPATLPPVQIPVMFSVPVEAFLTPSAPVPPVQLPVMFSVPVEAFLTPSPPDAKPPMQFPVMFNVPVEEFLAPLALAVPPFTFPTIEADVPAAPEKTTAPAFKFPANEFAVSVTPLESVNEPPFVAPFAVSILTSPVAPRLVETLTVMANEFAMRTSPAANVTADAVPAGAVAQTSAALMFPALRA
jgi:hypothetical protein